MKKHLYIIAIIIGLTFCGIIGVQYYWVVKIISSEKVSFNYQVTGAIMEVVKYFENDEIAKEIHQHYNTDIATDSLSQRPRFDEYDKSHDQLDLNNDDFYSRKTILTNEFFRHLYNSNKKKLIEQRIDSTVLDSVIKADLFKRHISTSYQYAIYHPIRDTLIYPHFSDKKVFFNNASSFMLFPTDKTKNPAFLLIFFPNNTNSIIKQIRPLIIFTVLLILFMLCCLIITFRIVFEQKKFAEVENDFINNMTHEFKTPIATIALAGEALTDPVIRKNPILMEQYLKTINEEDKRLEAMAETILNTAKLNKGKINLKKEYIDVNEIITDVVEKFKMQVEIKDGEITLDLQATDSEIYADRLHITNVITNLLDNANKYSPKKPLIKISTKSSNNFLIIYVKDNGIGIDKSDQKKIFLKLYRVPTGDIHNFKGFGLGLSYVKAIVDAHGGHVGVESELGKGSTFIVYLPFKLQKIKKIKNNEPWKTNN